jgi:2-methylcitrate dehydratase
VTKSNADSKRTLAERMTDYAQGLRFEDLPAEVVHEAKRVTVDALGCAFGAYNEEPVVVGRKVAMNFSAKNGSTILGTKHVAPPDWTAFVNGCMVRYFDYNDTYLSKEPAHPSDNIPACLSAGESAGASGRDLITAIVIAYEVQCRLADAASIRSRGWDHVTYGAFSTALGASKLFKLDPKKMRHALGIAGVASAALRQSRVGELSHWKGTAFANAARHGVYAALLAREGMTGPAPIFEGEKGFEILVSGPLTALEGPFAEGGSHASDGYMIMKSCIKYVPAEYHAQSAIAATLKLREQLGTDSEVDSILVESHDAAVDIIGSEPEKWKPTHRETADHSLPYMVAAAFVDGEITSRQFEPERFTDPKLLDVVQRVKVERHAELSSMYPEAVGNIVTIRLKNGKEASLRIDYPPGHAKNRLSDAQLLQKYHTLSNPILGEKKAKAVADWVWRMDKVQNLKELFEQAEVTAR